MNDKELNDIRRDAFRKLGDIIDHGEKVKCATINRILLENQDALSEEKVRIERRRKLLRLLMSDDI